MARKPGVGALQMRGWRRAGQVQFGPQEQGKLVPPVGSHPPSNPRSTHTQPPPQLTTTANRLSPAASWIQKAAWLALPLLSFCTQYDTNRRPLAVTGLPVGTCLGTVEAAAVTAWPGRAAAGFAAAGAPSGDWTEAVLSAGEGAASEEVNSVSIAP